MKFILHIALAALIIAPLVEADSTLSQMGASLRKASPCKDIPKNPGFVATIWRAPLDPYPSRTLHQRLAYVAGQFRKFGIADLAKPDLNKGIEFRDSPESQMGRIFNADVEISNYTVVIDVYFRTKKAGKYNFDFDVGDAGMFQVGAMNGVCEGSFDGIVNPFVSFRRFSPVKQFLTTIDLEANSTYPLRIIATNLFHKSGLSFEITDPDGQKVHIVDIFENDREEPEDSDEAPNLADAPGQKSPNAPKVSGTKGPTSEKTDEYDEESSVDAESEEAEPIGKPDAHPKGPFFTENSYFAERRIKFKGEVSFDGVIEFYGYPKIN